jgi:hypothetical protein
MAPGARVPEYQARVQFKKQIVIMNLLGDRRAEAGCFVQL